MDLLDALFCRKTVYKYSKETLEEKTLDYVRRYYASMSGMPGEARCEMEIVDNRHSRLIRSGTFGAAAPYYLVFYADEAENPYRTIGFRLQKMALYLCTLGLGTTFLMNRKLAPKLKKKNDLQACAFLGFGKSMEPNVRKKSEAVRMSAVQLSIYSETPVEWVSRLIDAARFAPSYKNEQPWRFLVCRTRFHVFCTSRNAQKLRWFEEIDFGGMFANIMTAAEELWLDVELVRQENITCKEFQKEQYLMSVVLNIREGYA